MDTFTPTLNERKKLIKPTFPLEPLGETMLCFIMKLIWNERKVGASCFSPLLHSEGPAHLKSIVEDCGLTLGWFFLTCQELIELFSFSLDMKIVSWNTREFGDASKWLAFKRFLKKHNPDLVQIQESKRDEFDIVFIKSFWSSKDIGWEFVESFGKSGGVLTMWDESKL